jgi:hypothetical protein
MLAFLHVLISSIDINSKIKFKPGEINFIFTCGKIVRPIEVKASDNVANIKVPYLEQFAQEHKLPFGIVLYGGMPYANPNKKTPNIVYWPYWLI